MGVRDGARQENQQLIEGPAGGAGLIAVLFEHPIGCFVTSITAGVLHASQRTDRS